MNIPTRWQIKLAAEKAGFSHLPDVILDQIVEIVREYEKMRIEQ